MTMESRASRECSPVLELEPLFHLDSIGRCGTKPAERHEDGHERCGHLAASKTLQSLTEHPDVLGTKGAAKPKLVGGVSMLHWLTPRRIMEYPNPMVFV